MRVQINKTDISDYENLFYYKFDTLDQRSAIYFTSISEIPEKFIRNQVFTKKIRIFQANCLQIK